MFNNYKRSRPLLPSYLYPISTAVGDSPITLTSAVGIVFPAPASSVHFFRHFSCSTISSTLFSWQPKKGLNPDWPPSSDGFVGVRLLHTSQHNPQQDVAFSISPSLSYSNFWVTHTTMNTFCSVVASFLFYLLSSFPLLPFWVRGLVIYTGNEV